MCTKCVVEKKIYNKIHIADIDNVVKSIKIKGFKQLCVE